MTSRIRRALLFSPGDDRPSIEAAAAIDVDAIVMDLEDGVVLNRKEQARQIIAHALGSVEFGHTERLVRINAVSDDNDLWYLDLEQTLPHNPDGYMLPKVESAEQVKRADDIITQAERRYGWLYHSVHLLAIVETALGFVNLKAIASAAPRLTALVFGAEDLAASLGAVRTSDGWEVFHARSALVLHAKAYGLQAIDTIYTDLTANDSQFVTEVEQAHYMGYTGKLAIHPRQVPQIQKAFTPSAARLRDARQLLAAFTEHQQGGQGVLMHAGRMVDLATVRAAEQLLAQARTIGLDVDE